MTAVRRVLSVLLAAVASVALLTACDVRGLGQARSRRPAPAVTAAADTPDAPDTPAGDLPQFAPGQLEQHFRKHGAEMGFATMEDYLRAAQALVRGGPGVETLQQGGDTLFFREDTDEFAVLSSRNVIRTYFRPDDGRRYWERQKQRRR
jgi:pyocin large subunit-like protein